MQLKYLSLYKVFLLLLFSFFFFFLVGGSANLANAAKIQWMQWLSTKSYIPKAIFLPLGATFKSEIPDPCFTELCFSLLALAGGMK